MISSPPNSGMVLWAGCQPQPVKAAALHSFKAENARINVVPERITSAAVRIVAGATAGLTLVRPGGGNSHVVGCGGMGTIRPGQSTAPVSVSVRKQAGTSAQAEYVQTTISFQAVAPARRPLPAGTGAVTMRFAITVAIA